MYCVISYICSDEYLPGIKALVHSLRRNDFTYDIIIYTVDCISESTVEQIKNLNVIVKHVEKIYYNGNQGNNNHNHRLNTKDKYWMCLTKLNIWKETNYNKILYLDADTCVFTNLNHLFDMNLSEPIAAVKDKSKKYKYIGINAGVLLIKPSLKLYDELIQALKSDKYSLRMSDQTFIYEFFQKKYKIYILDEKYNRLQKQNSSLENVAIFHWHGVKPWIDENVSNSTVWLKYFRD